MSCPDKTLRCVNCHEHFENLRPTIKQVLITHHFKKELPDFDSSLITDCKHEFFVRLHKFEEKVGLLKIYPGIKPEMIKAFKGYKGLVLEGTGLGHAPINHIDDITKTINIAKGMVGRGYSDSDIQGVLGENWLRVFKRAWGK